MSFTTGEIYLIMQNRQLNADLNTAVSKLSGHYAAALTVAGRNAGIANRNAHAARSACEEVAALSEMIALLEIENAELRSRLNQVEGERDQALSIADELVRLAHKKFAHQ